ncbi:MAG: carboxy terminal-processing peptidase [Nitrospiraceae bacterium]|nr:carboxy terminal-processing peptidase [Nitrospiraceae bacterium]
MRQVSRSSLLKRLFPIFALLFLFVGLYGAFGFDDLGSTEQNRARLLAHLIKQELVTHHFTHKKIDDAFSKDAFGLYLKQLDPQKRFLLKEDVNKLSSYESLLDDELNSGKIKAAYEGEGILKKRIAVVQEMIRDLLSKDFDFSSAQSVEIDPDKLDFCATDAELKERWRRILTYQTLTRHLNMLEDEAQKQKAEDTGDKPAKKAPQQKDAREKLLKNYETALAKSLHEKDADGYNRFFNAVAHAFDPHTDYMPPSNKEEFDISMKGSLEGIGATLKEDDGYIRVVSIVPGSPSYRQGKLQVDDIILKAAEKDKAPVDLTDMSLTDAVKLIRGKKGTEVRLTVRKADSRQVIIPIVRDVIQLEDASAKATILSAEKEGKTFGYIKIPSFYRDFEGTKNGGPGRNVTDDVRAELKKFASSRISGLILDLRNNGGGALTDAVKTTGLFVKTGPVVQIRSSGGRMSVLSDDDPGVEYAGPLVVLVNKISASASEILAAALQDYGRAVIIGGEHTHGKGTVQSIVDLNDRISFAAAEKYKPLGALKLTTQKFYRISGESTQYRGVIPDIIVPDRFQGLKSEEQNLDFALPWDTVNPVPYDTWKGGGLNISELKDNSSRRVAANKEFQEIVRMNKRILDRRKKTLQSLNIDVIRKEREESKIEEAEDAGIHGRPRDKKHTGEALTQEERAAAWNKEVREDVYVQEGMAVLLDMLSSGQKAARN